VIDARLVAFGLEQAAYGGDFRLHRLPRHR